MDSCLICLFYLVTEIKMLWVNLKTYLMGLDNQNGMNKAIVAYLKQQNEINEESMKTISSLSHQVEVLTKRLER